MPRMKNEPEANEFQERVVAINRVSKVVKGGKRFRFATLVVTGDGSSQVGIGIGKAKEIAEPSAKASTTPKKNSLPYATTTTPFLTPSSERSDPPASSSSPPPKVQA